MQATIQLILPNSMQTAIPLVGGTPLAARLLPSGGWSYSGTGISLQLRRICRN